MRVEDGYSGEGRLPNQQLIEKIHCQQVLDGKWVTPYHVQTGWQPAEELSAEQTTILEAGLQAVDPRPRWQPEAFHVTANNNPLTFLTVVLNAEGVPPIRAPLFKGNPSLNLKDVFYKGLQGKLHKVKDRQYSYKDSYRFNFPLKKPTPLIGVDVPTDVLPEINNIIISPFRYFDKATFKGVGDDPWRCEFKIIGIPREILEWSAIVHKIMSVKGVLEPGKSITLPPMPLTGGHSSSE